MERTSVSLSRSTTRKVRYIIRGAERAVNWLRVGGTKWLRANVSPEPGFETFSSTHQRLLDRGLLPHPELPPATFKFENTTQTSPSIKGSNSSTEDARRECFVERTTAHKRPPKTQNAKKKRR